MSVFVFSLGVISPWSCHGNQIGCRPPAAGPVFEDRQISGAERKLGPFEVGEREFTVVLRLQKIEGAPDGFEETVESLAIVDDRSVEHYGKAFHVEVGEGRFTETVGISAWALENDGRRNPRPEAVGLILYYGYIPSAPSSGQSCQVFSLKKGRLTPSSAPLTVYGRIHDLEPGSRPESKKLGQNGTMEFGVWTGWFEVIVPVRILDELRVIPIHRQLTYGLDAFAVAVERAPEDRETFVRLFRSPEDTAPAHIIVRKDSTVEFLWAYTKASIDTGKEDVVIVVGERPWLKVKIDGKEGFVKDEEDLMALGLRPAG